MTFSAESFLSRILHESYDFVRIEVSLPFHQIKKKWVAAQSRDPHPVPKGNTWNTSDATTATQRAVRQEAIVLTHEQVGFHNPKRIKGNTNDNEQGRPAEE